MYPKFETLKQTLGHNKAKMFISLPVRQMLVRSCMRESEHLGTRLKLMLHDVYFPRSTAYENLMTGNCACELRWEVSIGVLCPSYYVYSLQQVPTLYHLRMQCPQCQCCLTKAAPIMWNSSELLCRHFVHAQLPWI